MNWLYLVQAISADVVSRLAAAGLPPLVDGSILIGPEHLAENASPNRIVFVPKSSRFLARDASARVGVAAPSAPQGAGVLSVLLSNCGRNYTTATVSVSAPNLTGGVQATATAVLGTAGVVHRVQMTAMGSGYTSAPTVTIAGDGVGALATAVLAPTAEQLAAAAQRPLWTEWQLYDVHLWGCVYGSSPVFQASNPDTDWDATATLGLVLMQSLNELAHGVHRLGALTWVSSQPQATKLQILGRYATLALEIAVPVPDVLLGFAPIGTHPVPTVSMILPDGTTSTPINLG